MSYLFGGTEKPPIGLWNGKVIEIKDRRVVFEYNLMPKINIKKDFERPKEYEWSENIWEHFPNAEHMAQEIMYKLSENGLKVEGYENKTIKTGDNSIKIDIKWNGALSNTAKIRIEADETDKNARKLFESVEQVLKESSTE